MHGSLRSFYTPSLTRLSCTGRLVLTRALPGPFPSHQVAGPSEGANATSQCLRSLSLTTGGRATHQSRNTTTPGGRANKATTQPRRAVGPPPKPQRNHAGQSGHQSHNATTTDGRATGATTSSADHLLCRPLLYYGCLQTCQRTSTPGRAAHRFGGSPAILPDLQRNPTLTQTCQCLPCRPHAGRRDAGVAV